MSLDLGKSVWGACSRAVHPARLKMPGNSKYPTSSGYLTGCLSAGFQFGWCQSPYCWSLASSELCVLLGRCARHFPKLYTTHTPRILVLQSFPMSLITEQNLHSPGCCSLALHVLPNETPEGSSMAPFTMSVFVEGLFHVWYMALFSLFCCFCSLYPWNWIETRTN